MPTPTAWQISLQEFCNKKIGSYCCGGISTRMYHLKGITKTPCTLISPKSYTLKTTDTKLVNSYWSLPYCFKVHFLTLFLGIFRVRDVKDKLHEVRLNPRKVRLTIEKLWKLKQLRKLELFWVFWCLVQCGVKKSRLQEVRFSPH